MLGTLWHSDNSSCGGLYQTVRYRPTAKHGINVYMDIRILKRDGRIPTILRDRFGGARRFKILSRRWIGNSKLRVYGFPYDLNVLCSNSMVCTITHRLVDYVK